LIEKIDSAYKFSASYYEALDVEREGRSYIADVPVIFQMYSDIDEEVFFTTVSELYEYDNLSTHSIKEHIPTYID
jgi:hypothetical protein